MDIAKVIKFATKKHEDQTDKAGKPYILHPMRVALRLETEQEKIVALLHDVLEDTDATIEDLKRLDLDENIINAIQTLTRPKDVTYMDYIKKIGTNKLARKVKLADLSDNMDPDRLCDDKESLMQRYEKAYKYLIELED